MVIDQPVDILLIEDQSSDEELILHALRQKDLDAKIEIARDGEEALRLLFNQNGQAVPPEHYPRLILLDIKLPKFSGLEILEKIKSHPEMKVIPVIMLSSSDRPEDITRSYLLGANSYLTKPVSYKQFSQLVQRAGTYWLKHNQHTPT